MATEHDVPAVLIASDHAGFGLKNVIADHLRQRQYRVTDVGCHSAQSVDYPDMAGLLVKKFLQEPEAIGIAICGTGIGISIAANRHPEIRCGLCHDVTTARATRAHNNANVVALGARIVGEAVALDIVDAFLATPFEGGRHERRVNKLATALTG